MKLIDLVLIHKLQLQLIAVGTTATTGQVSVTFTYVQANNLQDATAV
jgi:hypothetical protein